MSTNLHPSSPVPPDLNFIRNGIVSPLPREPEDRSHAAVALVLAGEDTDLSVCLIRRAEHELDRWSGHVALPGGRVDPTDRNSCEAAIRETREEVGIRLERSNCLGLLSNQPIERDGKPGDLSLLSYVFHLGEALAPFEPNDEVAEAFWVPLRHLLDPRNAGYRPTIRDNLSYNSPAVLFQGHPIWGLTYRVLTVFFERASLQIARPAP